MPNHMSCPHGVSKAPLGELVTEILFFFPIARNHVIKYSFFHASACWLINNFGCLFNVDQMFCVE